MNVLINMLDPGQLEHLREQFHVMDKDQTGYISAAELQLAVRESAGGTGDEPAEEEIERIVREVDYHENGKINYSEFLAATLRV